jgi:hypothetical protein
MAINQAVLCNRSTGSAMAIMHIENGDHARCEWQSRTRACRPMKIKEMQAACLNIFTVGGSKGFSMQEDFAHSKKTHIRGGIRNKLDS